MADKAPLKSDHGKGLFEHVRGVDRGHDQGKQGGISPHARGLSREHEKQPLPSIPWAVSDRVAPKKGDTEGVSPHGLPSSNRNQRPMPATAAPGRTELGNPDVHLAPKRRVAGKNGLPLHEEERPAALRRARLHTPNALSAKLSSELKVADAHNGKHHSGHLEHVHGGKNSKQREGRSPALGGSEKPDAAHGRIGNPSDTPGPETFGSEY